VKYLHSIVKISIPRYFENENHFLWVTLPGTGKTFWGKRMASGAAEMMDEIC
jgi:hypothetical protein